MQHMPPVEAARLNGIMRSIQKKFVVTALADELRSDTPPDGLDDLVTAVARKCRDQDADFSDALVRELIIEIAGIMGYDGPLA
jgi:hypothetical protein